MLSKPGFRSRRLAKALLTRLVDIPRTNPLTNTEEKLGPDNNKWVKKLEPAMVVIGIIGPFALLPQVTKVYFTHVEHAAGHSLISWFLFAILSLIWMSYGIYLKKPSIYIGNAISLVLNALMIIGIVSQVGLTY